MPTNSHSLLKDSLIVEFSTSNKFQHKTKQSLQVETHKSKMNLQASLKDCWPKVEIKREARLLLLLHKKKWLPKNFSHSKTTLASNWRMLKLQGMRPHFLKFYQLSKKIFLLANNHLLNHRLRNRWGHLLNRFIKMPTSFLSRLLRRNW